MRRYIKAIIVLTSLVFLMGLKNSSLHHTVKFAWQAGLFESSDCVSDGEHGGHQAQMHTCGQMELVKEVSELEMRVGKNFGIQYAVIPSEEGTCFEETRVLIHPPMKQPDGRITTEYARSYSVGSCPDAIPFGVSIFSWFVEHEWEAVKGEWQFKILVDGEQIISQEFRAY